MGHESELLRSSYDVVIVGARCAGAATAMLLAREGVRVLAIDRQPYGADTLSTHALMRPALIQLSRWNLLEGLIGSGAPVIPTTTFHYGDDEVCVPIRPEPGIPGLIAPRRTVLDRALVDAARAAGAAIVHDVAVHDVVCNSAGRVSGVLVRDGEGAPLFIRADVVVGADGLGSTVARKCRAATLARGTASVAHIYGYAPAPGYSGYHWYFRKGVSGGLIPTNDGLACIVASVPTARYDNDLRFAVPAGRLSVLRDLSPELAESAAAGGATPVRAFRGVQGLLRQAHGPGWMLVGDAGFFRDPLTSHGISDALRDAEGAARAILAASEFEARRYQEERDALAMPILEATDSICAFDWALVELGERHKRFSEAMKVEVAVLADRRAQEEAVACTRGMRFRGQSAELATTFG